MTTAGKLALAFILVLVGIGARAPRATADVTVCNNFTYPVYVAIGYKTANEMKTEGWWLVESNGCQMVDNRDVSGAYYLHAHTAWIQQPDGNRVRHAWGKGTRLAVDSHKFEFYRADQIGSGDQVAEFTQVGAGQYPNINYRILDEQNSEIRESN
ncbi:MAG TPA: DUF1036 domain-containing protein [Candidatus Bathyarchaeia archaeon]|nr:DUF1036 domain-containing protein [Candidatus Bathyarchaeia archaeon]